MTSTGDLADELRAMQAALAAPSAREPKPPLEAEAETLLDELKKALADAADKAEELVDDHPAAAVGGAFLLGFLIGHHMGGRGK